MTAFNWEIFIPRTAIASTVLLFALTWSAWLWCLICRPNAWNKFVLREHAVMASMGLPSKWARPIYYAQTRWPMKAILLLTIVLSIFTLRLL